jgi:hypothetical protein
MSTLPVPFASNNQLKKNVCRRIDTLSLEKPFL